MCIRDRNQPGPLVVEVGANEGAHGLVAARWGCRVHSFEPQPSCVRRLAFAIAMQPQNHHTAVLHHNYVSDVNFTQLVPFSPCSGTFQIGAARNISHKHGIDMTPEDWNSKEHTGGVMVQAVSLDDALPQGRSKKCAKRRGQ
eukprot:TRINITY_DN28220_c0_g1_i1.p1 TRINITY_DN28220_c0_g1~~TRINITY_DN28220_c0_g1_i1.p1  ORF type:complete len:142 (-),score=29.09 TRINITY_DN28220_c0_g1_i1:170-595(-)